MKIAEILESIRGELPSGTRLVAVSKYHPAEAIAEAYDAGQRIFGESHVQELEQKHQVLPSDIEWHFIGHLQTNKVRFIAPYVSLIHAVDSDRLLREIHKQATRCGRRIPVLLQIHIAEEETKYGFAPEEFKEYLQSNQWAECTGVEIRGIMCMASNVDDANQIRDEFRQAHELFLWAKEHIFPHQDSFCECSWGMSDDYPIAVQEGSTLVRIGSKIFGSRK